MPMPTAPDYPAAFTDPSTQWFRGAPMSLAGLALNTTDSNGVAWIVEKVEGWGSPGSTLDLQQRARAHGATDSESFLRPRTLRLDGVIDAPSPELLRASVDALITACSLGPVEFAVREAGLVRHLKVRRQDEVLLSWVDDQFAEFSLQLVAPDPLRYGDLVTVSTHLPSVSGGRTFPVTYPTTYTGVTNSGIITVRNEGNAAAPVWLRVDGPVPDGGWSVIHLGKRPQLVFSSSLALGAGEFVTVDMGAREVLAQGQSARNGWVTSRGWFDLDPGVNEVAFTAESYSPDARLTLTTMSAWS